MYTVVKVDREQSSFFPLSHARRAPIYIIMQINSKNEEGLGRGRKKDDRGAFIVFLNYRFSETEILDWSATCQSVNKTTSAPTK